MSRTYRDQIECLEAIGALLVRNVPAQWERIEATCEIERALTAIRCRFQPPGESAANSHFGMEKGEDSLDLHGCFMQLSKFVGDKKTGPFKTCRYVLDKTGRYHADYDY